MDWVFLAESVKALAGIVGIFGVPAAYVTYRRSVRTRRADWLVSLHEKFFEAGRYARVRRLLDYRPEPEYSDFVQAVAQQRDHSLADEFYRYLNFFELLASLRKLGQISNEEIRFERLSELIRTAPLLPRR